jgi:hypothetical protein
MPDDAPVHETAFQPSPAAYIRHRWRCFEATAWIVGASLRFASLRLFDGSGAFNAAW